MNVYIYIYIHIHIYIGVSKPTVYIFPNSPSVCIDKLQTTVQKKGAYVYTRGIKEMLVDPRLPREVSRGTGRSAPPLSVETTGLTRPSGQ